MASVERACPPPLRREGGHLFVGGVSCREIVEEIATPCFVFDAERIRRNTDILRPAAASGDVTVRYCAKTNHELAVLELVESRDCEVLVSHRAELALARIAGFPPERIAYQRPWAPDDELAAVVVAGVGLVHVHRPEDVGRIAEVASEAGRRVSLSLRLRAERRRSFSPLATLAERTGLTAGDALEAARASVGHPSLRLVGLNRYVGTQQSSAQRLERSLVSMLELAEHIERETGARIREINVGGGIPSPSLRKLGPATLWRRLLDSWPPVEADRKSRIVGRLVDTYRRAVERSDTDARHRLVIEPGRAVVGDAAVLLTRIVASEGRWLTCDASRAFLPESPLLFRRPIVVDGDDFGAAGYRHLSGSTLNTMDVLDFWRRLPQLDPGALLALSEAGAYSTSRASRYGTVSPPVVLVDGDRVSRVRRAETVADLLGPMRSVSGEARVER